MAHGNENSKGKLPSNIEEWKKYISGEPTIWAFNYMPKWLRRPILIIPWAGISIVLGLFLMAFAKNFGIQPSTRALLLSIGFWLPLIPLFLICFFYLGISLYKRYNLIYGLAVSVSLLLLGVCTSSVIFFSICSSAHISTILAFLIIATIFLGCIASGFIIDAIRVKLNEHRIEREKKEERSKGKE